MLAAGSRSRDLHSRVTDADAVTRAVGHAVVLADPSGSVTVAFADRGIRE
jgi:hypothetical protein